MRSSPLAARYTEEVDRESAYEQLAARVRPAATEEDGGSPQRRARRTTDRPSRRPPAPAESPMEQVLTSGTVRQMARSAAAVVGREIARSIFGIGRR